MAIRALLWQSAKGVASVGALYRNQCVEAIRICRNLKSDSMLHLGNMPSHLLLELACTALDSAAREDPRAEQAFAAFREAVEELHKSNTTMHGVANSMAAAKMRDDIAANRHQSILAKLLAHDTEDVLSYRASNYRSLCTFFIPPCDHVAPISKSTLLVFNFHIDRSATLPELVFRFHRKHRQRWSSKQPFQPLKFPHFYAKQELDEIRQRVVRPLDNNSLSALAPIDTIWVYGDRACGHYELVRGVRQSRLRSVSFAPADDGLKRVYRDMCGYLASEHFLFSEVFAPWMESATTLRNFKPSAYIREDTRRPGSAVIEENPSLTDMAIVSLVTQEVVHRALETTISRPFDGYVTETMFALQGQVEELSMPGGLSLGPKEAALLALNPLTREDWWGLKPKLTSFVAPVRSRFWRRS